MRRTRSSGSIAAHEGEFMRVDALHGPHELALANPATSHHAVHDNIATFSEARQAAAFARLRRPPDGLEWRLLDHGKDWKRSAFERRVRMRPDQVTIAALLGERRAPPGPADSFELLVWPGASTSPDRGEPYESSESPAELKRLMPYFRRPFCSDPVLVTREAAAERVRDLRAYPFLCGPSVWLLAPARLTRDLALLPAGPPRRSRSSPGRTKRPAGPA